MTFEDVLREVEQTISYIRAATEAPAEDGWVRCDRLTSDPDLLVELIRSTAPGRGTDEIDVAASLFVEGYAYRVASVALVACALGLPVPDTDPRLVAFRIARDRPSHVAHLSTELLPADPERLARALLEEHMAPLVVAVRSRVKVGERLLWGNIGSSFAKVFLAVASGTGDPAVQARAEAFFTADRLRTDGAGSFTTVRIHDRDGWFFTRTTCCLWFRTTSAAKCGDCSLLTPAELAEGRRRELFGADA